MPPPNDAPRPNLLRTTLVGKCVCLALMLHAAIGLFVCLVAAERTPAGLLLVGAGGWIIGRAAGAFAYRGFSPFVSMGLLAAVLMLGPPGSAEPASLWPAVLWLAFLVMLLVVHAVDLMELAASRRGKTFINRLRRWNWSRIAILGCVVMLVSYLVLIPAIGLLAQQLWPAKTSRVLEDLSLAEQVRIRSTEAVVAMIFFSCGAAVGSFLNVVVYRAPRGESVAFQRSHCPRCGAQIKGRDNVPILGWLLLNGRCRDCHAPISRRYPVVEAVTALLFLSMYFVELISGGANVPIRRPNHYHGLVWILLYTKWDLVGLYLFHCFALCALLTWTLIDIDGKKIPAWLRWGVVSVLGVLPAIWPNLLPVDWWLVSASAPTLPSRLTSSAVTNSFLGGLVSVLLAWLSSTAILGGGREARSDASAGPKGGHAISAGLIVGLSLGWQAAAGTWLLTLLLRPMTLWAARRANTDEPPVTLLVLTAFLVQLLGWRLSTVGWWPSARTTPAAWAVLGLVIAALLAVNRAARRQTAAREEPAHAAEKAADIPDPFASGAPTAREPSERL